MSDELLQMHIAVEVFYNENKVPTVLKLTDVPTGFPVPFKRSELISKSQINNEGLKQFILDQYGISIDGKRPNSLKFSFSDILIQDIAEKDDVEFILDKYGSVIASKQVTKRKIGKSIIVMREMDDPIIINGGEPKTITEVKINNRVTPCDLHIDIGNHGVGQIDCNNNSNIFGIFGMIEAHFELK